MIGRVLPVGAFVTLFRAMLEADPLYSDLWLEGEITDVSRSAAGHTYFSLRDEDGAMKCVLFRGQALRLPQLPVSGAQVAVHGGLTLYPRTGAVQFSVDMLQPAGLGAAALELEYLRQRLAAEGLFDPSRKRLLPAWPRTIGVVTSPHGAAWHDVQTVIGRRYPLVSLVLSPTAVEGDGAAEGIVAALEALQREEDVDLIIVARGGGSGDDLAPFNDERVVRAVFACGVPVVAGIGHATDVTLAEDAADVVAPTPSAAAEICVPSLPELSYRIFTLRERLTDGLKSQQDVAQAAAKLAESGLARCCPQARVAVERERLAKQREQLRVALGDRLAAMRHDVASRDHLLAALDPVAVLNRGYAALHDVETARPVFSVDQAARVARLRATLADGAVDAKVETVLASDGQWLALPQ
jgi:exodeoxyribonuclease VII large subunit